MINPLLKGRKIRTGYLQGREYNVLSSITQV